MLSPSQLRLRRTCGQGLTQPQVSEAWLVSHLRKWLQQQKQQNLYLSVLWYSVSIAFNCGHNIKELMLSKSANLTFLAFFWTSLAFASPMWTQPTSVSPSCKDELLRFVCGEYSHVKPKRGAKYWMHHIFTHNKLPLFWVLQVPPDLSHGSVMTVRGLTKQQMNFLSLFFFLARGNQ